MCHVHTRMVKSLIFVQGGAEEGILGYMCLYNMAEGGDRGVCHYILTTTVLSMLLGMGIIIIIMPALMTSNVISTDDVN